jgi:hypothetical protein
MEPDALPPSEATVPPLDEAPPPRLRRFAGRAAAAILGLALGLGGAEAMFRHRDGGAFPLVNVYERDAIRGVRLSPGSSTVVGRPGERVTHVRVNREGYRGPDWPAPSGDEVLVVGDSLSFGLGVEEEEALPARLHAALPGSPPVIDASVPTYGPPEYLATLDQVLAARREAAAVVVLNLINDLVEVDQPNVGRHRAVDGWAARVESDPGGDGTSSPLRTWAIQRSHAAFALWRWQRTRTLEAASLPPDPGLGPVIALGARVAANARGIDEHRREEALRLATLVGAEQELAAARRGVVSLARKYSGLASFVTPIAEEWLRYLNAEGAPEEDVFTIYTGGCIPPIGPDGRFVDLRKRVRFSGERIQKDVEDLLQDYARTAPARVREEIRAAFARRAEAEATLAALPKGPRPAPPPAEPLPIVPFVTEAQAMAAKNGARLLLVVAPIDVQASPAARQRRGTSDAEAAALDALSAEIAASARAAGAAGIDAAPALRAEGDAAFLPDGHLSPRGHEVLGHAAAAAIAGLPGAS